MNQTIIFFVYPVKVRKFSVLINRMQSCWWGKLTLRKIFWACENLIGFGKFRAKEGFGGQLHVTLHRSVREYPLKTLWKILVDVWKMFIQTGDRPGDLNWGKETVESQHYLSIPSKVTCQSDKQCFKRCRKKNPTAQNQNKTKNTQVRTLILWIKNMPSHLSVFFGLLDGC